MSTIITILSFLLYPLVIIAAALVFIIQHPATALWAVLGGIVPSLVWLYFWIQEDRLHPEPKKIILRSFGAGMIAVIVAVGLERVIQMTVGEASLVTFLLFATVEELFKYGAAYISCLNTRYNDEPIDAVIYLISAALGFAALENTFFLNTPLLQNNIVGSVVTGNLRFIGANLLHITSSAIIGISIAFSFYKPRWQKKLYLIVGIILAIGLHALFNFFIIKAGQGLLIIFGIVWLGIIALILVLEKIKQLKSSKE